MPKAASATDALAEFFRDSDCKDHYAATALAAIGPAARAAVPILKTRHEKNSYYDSHTNYALFEITGDEATRLVRRTERNVKHFEELRLQGQTGPMVAVRRTVGQTVDDNFPTFQRIALDKKGSVQRNMAIQAIGLHQCRQRMSNATALAMRSPRTWWASSWASAMACSS